MQNSVLRLPKGILLFECAFSEDGSFPRSVGQIWATLLLPFMIVVLFATTWILWWNVKGRPEFYLQLRLSVIVLTVLYVFYMNITENVTRVFGCISVVEECGVQGTNMEFVPSHLIIGG